MTIRIEEDLRARFAEVAKQLHRPAAQVVRDSMRDFVRDNSNANTASAADDSNATVVGWVSEV
jgi:predicted transcriptional regulator